MNEITEIPFGQRTPGRKDVAFALITCEHAPQHPEAHGKVFRYVLMSLRWDNKLGFIGGGVDEGESLKEAVLREIEEEAGIDLRASALTELVSHTNGKINIHAYTVDLGFLNDEEIRDYQMAGADAEHATWEGFSSWWVLNKFTINTLVESNMLASAVKEELKLFLNRFPLK